MPELPEVEHAARRLRLALAGQTMTSVLVLHPSLAKSLTPAACRRLKGRTVIEVERRAKLQLVHLDDGQLLEVHFRMTGDWNIGRVGDPPPPLARAHFNCDDGTRVSLVDARAFGVIKLHAAGGFVMPDLGPEPLGVEPLAGETEFRRNSRVCAIHRVADAGVSLRSHVHADLVSATGLKLDLA